MSSKQRKIIILVIASVCCIIGSFIIWENYPALSGVISVLGSIASIIGLLALIYSWLPEKNNPPPSSTPPTPSQSFLPTTSPPVHLPGQRVPPPPHKLPTPSPPRPENIRRSRTRVLLTSGVLVLLILAGVVWVAISHSQLLPSLPPFRRIDSRALRGRVQECWSRVGVSRSSARLVGAGGRSVPPAPCTSFVG